MHKILMMFVAIVFSSNIYAGWSEKGNVLEVFSYKGKHFVQTTITNNPCGVAGKFWWPTTDNSDAKDMLALSLSAFMSGKRIRLIYDEAAPSCSSNGAEGTKMGLSN